MRVICINDKWTGPANIPPEVFTLEFGKPYTVIDTQKHFNASWYQLEENPYRHIYFLASHFAPSSDIDETEDEGYKQRDAEKILVSKLMRPDIEKAYDDMMMRPHTHFNCRCTIDRNYLAEAMAGVINVMKEFVESLSKAARGFKALLDEIRTTGYQRAILRIERNARRQQLHKRKLSFTK